MGAIATKDGAGTQALVAREHKGVTSERLGPMGRTRTAARVPFGELPDEVLRAAEPDFSAQNRRFVKVVGDWLRAQVEAGLIVDRSFEVTHALWLGPGLEFCRRWLAGRARHGPLHVAEDFADGAWNCLAAQ